MIVLYPTGNVVTAQNTVQHTIRTKQMHRWLELAQKRVGITDMVAVVVCQTDSLDGFRTDIVDTQFAQHRRHVHTGINQYALLFVAYIRAVAAASAAETYEFQQFGSVQVNYGSVQFRVFLIRLFRSQVSASTHHHRLLFSRHLVGKQRILQ